jgi:hypothetical protein
MSVPFAIEPVYTIRLRYTLAHFRSSVTMMLFAKYAKIPGLSSWRARTERLDVRIVRHQESARLYRVPPAYLLWRDVLIGRLTSAPGYAERPVTSLR